MAGGHFNQLLPEGVGLAVVREIHDGFCAEFQRHTHLVQLDLIVFCIPGDAQVYVDLSPQALADALGAQGLVVDVGRNGDLAQSYSCSNHLRVGIFFFCYRFHFWGNDPLLGSFHLCCVISHNSSVLSSRRTGNDKKTTCSLDEQAATYDVLTIPSVGIIRIRCVGLLPHRVETNVSSQPPVQLP